MKKVIKTMISFVIVAAIFILVRNLGFLDFGDLIHDRNCADEIKLKNSYIAGKVVDKYRDRKNHNVKTLSIMDTDNRVKNETFLMLDVSGAYDSILIGDKVEKKINELVLLIERNGHKRRLVIDYDCRSEKNYARWH